MPYQGGCSGQKEEVKENHQTKGDLRRLTDCPVIWYQEATGPHQPAGGPGGKGRARSSWNGWTSGQQVLMKGQERIQTADRALAGAVEALALGGEWEDQDGALAGAGDAPALALGGEEGEDQERVLAGAVEAPALALGGGETNGEEQEEILFLLTERTAYMDPVSAGRHTPAAHYYRQEVDATGVGEEDVEVDEEDVEVDEEEMDLLEEGEPRGHSVRY